MKILNPNSVLIIGATLMKILNPNSVLIIGATLLITASHWKLIAEYGSIIPYWDQWDSEAIHFLMPYLDGQLEEAIWLSPHNEHRIFWTRLWNLALFEGNQQLWDPLLQMSANAILLATAVGIFLHIQRKLLGEQPVFIPLFAIAFALPLAWENTLGGFQSQFYFLIIWSLLFFLTFQNLFWGGFFATAAYFSLASGVLVVLAILPILFHQILTESSPKERFKTSVLLGVYGVLAALMLAFMSSSPEHHAPLKASSLTTLLLALQRLMSWPSNAGFIGIIWHLPPLIWLLSQLARRQPLNTNQQLLAGLWIWGVLQLAALAYGRGAEGFHMYIASRYIQLLLLAQWIPLLVLAQWKSVHGNVLVALGLALLTLGNLLLLPEVQRDLLRKYQNDTYQFLYTSEFLRTQDLSVLQNKPHLHIPYPSAERLASALQHPLLPQHFVAPIQVPPPLVGQGTGFTLGGAYETTPPLIGSVWGSLAPNHLTGRWESDWLTLSASFMEIPIAGYLTQPCLQLSLLTQDDRQIPIEVERDPRESWQWVRLVNPGSFRLVAENHCPNSHFSWFAFGAPRRVGVLSIAAEWGRQQADRLFLIGLGLLIFPFLRLPLSSRLE